MLIRISNTVVRIAIAFVLISSSATGSMAQYYASQVINSHDVILPEKALGEFDAQYATFPNGAYITLDMGDSFGDYCGIYDINLYFDPSMAFPDIQAYLSEHNVTYSQTDQRTFTHSATQKGIAVDMWEKSCCNIGKRWRYIRIVNMGETAYLDAVSNKYPPASKISESIVDLDPFPEDSCSCAPISCGDYPPPPPTGAPSLSTTGLILLIFFIILCSAIIMRSTNYQR